MISDSTTIADLRNEWAGVLRMRERMQLLCVGTFAFGSITAPALAKVLYNLPLLLAHDVLGHTLKAARDEGAFACKSSFLGRLMDAANGSVPFNDWTSLRDGVQRRNLVAHDGVLFEANQCLDDIQRIEDQLRAWSIL